MDNDELLCPHGLQVTAQRLAVLTAVPDRPHSTADDIDAIMRVGTLTDKGLLRRGRAPECVAAISVSCDG